MPAAAAMPPEIELLSLILTLQPSTPWPVDRPLPGWWGRAAQSLLLRIVDAENPALAAQMHDENKDNRPPYTTSSLMGRGFRQVLDANGHYQLRLTALTPTLCSILIRAAESGGILAPGAVVELEFHPFTILESSWQSVVEPWSIATSYAALSAPRLIGEAPPRQVSLNFTSPVTFQTFGVTLPFPRQDLIFSSLLEAWNTYSPLTFPPETSRYANECLVINRYDLKTRSISIKNGYMRIGAIGQITFTSTNYDRYWLGILHTLAAYAPFCGIGWGTTIGLGQCHQV